MIKVVKTIVGIFEAGELLFVLAIALISVFK